MESPRRVSVAPDDASSVGTTETALPVHGPARVLLLEDSDIDAELVQTYLLHSRLPLLLTRVARRSEYMAAIESLAFDLVLADYSLPDFDGLSALRLAREHLPDVPFVFVSGVVGEDIATDALRHGATDYVLKRNLGRLPTAVARALAEARERAQRRHAEAALDTSEANTRLAVEAAELGMWDYAAATDSFSLDPRCLAMCGLVGAAQVTRATFVGQCHPQVRAEVEARLEALIGGASGTRLLLELRIADARDGQAGHGGERWLVMRGESMRGDDGHAPRVLGMLQDVTEQKLAAARQRRTELMFRLAAEAADIGVWELDPRTGSLWFDDGVRMLADIPPDATMTYRDLLRRVVHPDDRAGFKDAIGHAADLDRSPEIDFEHRMVGLGNQQVRWVAVKGRRIVDADGEMRLVGTARDVTTERREGEALAERVTLRTRERDRIWNLSADLMDVRRPDGSLTSVNPAWQRLLGWSAEHLLNANVLHFTHVDDTGVTIAAMDALRGGQATVRFDNRCRQRDGGYRWIRWTASGEAGLFYAIGRDVTDEKAAADQLAATNRELKAQIEERSRVEATLQQMQRLEAVGQLTAGVAHDFNNLLTVVLSNIALVHRLLQLGPEPDPRVLQRLDSMRSAAERGANLTSQLLAFSRRQRLEPQAVDLNEIALGMRDLLQTTMGGSVRLEIDLAETLWPALVDPTQLELIILNLAINARDAMEVGGSLTLCTANVTLTDTPVRPEHPEPGDYVALTVVDTGSGMPPDVLSKAFEPFFTTKAVGRGSGLGLPQVYGFAKQSGGGVRIDTQVGHGTAVHVFMPRAGRVSQAPARSTSGRADIAPQRAAAGQTLLLVDDDAAVREVTSSVLAALGYEVVQTDNGPAALAILRDRDDIDLVVADFAMPGMNGAEMARAVAVMKPALPVLFITGFVDLAALSHVPEDHVLQKPFREDHLAQRLQRLLSRRAPRPALTE